MAYTRQHIIEEIETAAKDNIAQFYNGNFVNRSGTTSDTKEYYTEIVSKWLADKIESGNNPFGAISVITRKDYKTDLHDESKTDLQDKFNKDSLDEIKKRNKRFEEAIAKDMHKRTLEHLGKILDYQTPLKNVRDDKAGKIDLLAYNKEENILRILELKSPDNKESMLRCVLEGYTYLKTVNTDKLLDSFNSKVPGDAAVKASPLVAYGNAQHKEMLEGRPELERLMKLLDCKPFYYTKENGEYIIREK